MKLFRRTATTRVPRKIRYGFVPRPKCRFGRHVGPWIPGVEWYDIGPRTFKRCRNCGRIRY